LTFPPPPRRDWFEQSIDSNIRTLELIKSGVWPEKIQGRAIVTTALWLLRTVYGDDLTSAIELRKIVLENEQRMQEVELGEAREPR